MLQRSFPTRSEATIHAWRLPFGVGWTRYSSTLPQLYLVYFSWVGLRPNLLWCNKDSIWESCNKFRCDWTLNLCINVLCVPAWSWDGTATQRLDRFRVGSLQRWYSEHTLTVGRNPYDRKAIGRNYFLCTYHSIILPCSFLTSLRFQHSRWPSSSSQFCSQSFASQMRQCFSAGGWSRSPRNWRLLYRLSPGPLSWHFQKTVVIGLRCIYQGGLSEVSQRPLTSSSLLPLGYSGET